MNRITQGYNLAKIRRHAQCSDWQLLHCNAVIRQQSGTAARLHSLPLALVSQVNLIDWSLGESVFKSAGIRI